MNMTTQKRYAAFLSFATPDRALVQAVHDLFSSVDEDTYFAPKDIPRSGSPKWRAQILDGIASSVCFVPIYSRHSLNRKWVLYESGAATALSLLRYPARVSGVSRLDLWEQPADDDHVYELFDPESLSDLVVNVCIRGDTTLRSRLEAEIRRKLSNNAHFDAVIRLSRARWVFIAGNVPRGKHRRPGKPPAYESETYERNLRAFVQKLTVGLLEAGFNIASCPQVRSVGSVVARTAGRWLYEHSESDPDRYQIGGLYPMDRFLREEKYSRPVRDLMRRYFLEFRESYLRDKEHLIIIGGSEGTAEECKAAKRCGVKVFAVPCFGGAAREVWDRSESISRMACHCVEEEGQCDTKAIIDHLLG